jgi:hypothetical protein
MAYTTAYTSLAGYLANAGQHPREMCRLLRTYYENNGLYDQLRLDLTHIGAERESLRPLRNPANRAVEFYAAKLWPGDLDALEIKAEHAAIVTPIQQVWLWSNWRARKQVAARWFALYGDLPIKVVQSIDRARVYFQLVRPEYITDFSVDERDYFTAMRLDVPITRIIGGQERAHTRTEAWDKASDSYRVWEHDRPADTPLANLGAPIETASMTADFGIDFVPFVMAKFRDIGDERGAGCFEHVLDKLDEANRLATRLHQMLFRHAGGMWALENPTMFDSAGRPVPPARVTKNADDEVEVGSEKMLRLPGGYTLRSLVPEIQYEAALAILESHIQEMERDLPELAYYRLREQSELSGRAIRLLLTDLIDKALEARGNAVDALVRANQMALTIGKQAGIEGFGGVGEYEAGDFTHTIGLPEIVPLSEIEQLETLEKKRDVLSIPATILQQEAGYSDEEIAAIAEAQAVGQQAQQQSLAAAMLELERRADRGQSPAITEDDA